MTHFQCHTATRICKVLSQVTSVCKKKIKCTFLRTLKSSIGTITIFARSSGSGSVLCADTIAGQGVSGVLAGDCSQVLLLIFDAIQPYT